MTTPTAPLTIRIGRKAYAIPDLAAASRMVCEARDRSGIGSSAFKPPLICEGDRPVGYVSFNGRVWPGLPTQWKAGAVPLFDNGAGV